MFHEKIFKNSVCCAVAEAAQKNRFNLRLKPAYCSLLLLTVPLLP